jgi:hypothetical protein
MLFEKVNDFENLNFIKMKKVTKYIAILTFALFVSVALNAQMAPHPDQNGDGSAVGGGVVGGGAPIGGGLITMLVLGAAYGAKKVYDLTKSE